MAELDIIITAYRSEAYLPTLQRSIEAYSTVDHNLIVFDNTEKQEPITTMRNRLARECSAPYICWFDADTIVSPDWDGRMLRALKADPQIGIAGPVTTLGHPCQDVRNEFIEFCGPGKKFHSEKDWPFRFRCEGVHGDDLVRFSEEIKDRSTVDCRLVHASDGGLFGFCIMMPRKVWKEVHGFEERFSQHGWDEEIVWRVRQRGMRSVCVQSSFVVHYGRLSIDEAQKRGELKPVDDIIACNALKERIWSGQAVRWDQLGQSAVTE